MSSTPILEDGLLAHPRESTGPTGRVESVRFTDLAGRERGLWLSFPDGVITTSVWSKHGATLEVAHGDGIDAARRRIARHHGTAPAPMQTTILGTEEPLPPAPAPAAAPEALTLFTAPATIPGQLALTTQENPA